MLDEERYKELLRRLDSNILHHGTGNRLISPTPASDGASCPPGVIYPEMGIEHLTQNELQMLHVNLHRFYPRGINGVDKISIERLHKLVKQKLESHKNFDQLDLKNE